MGECLDYVVPLLTVACYQPTVVRINIANGRFRHDCHESTTIDHYEDTTHFRITPGTGVGLVRRRCQSANDHDEPAQGADYR